VFDLMSAMVRYFPGDIRATPHQLSVSPALHQADVTSILL